MDLFKPCSHQLFHRQPPLMVIFNKDRYIDQLMNNYNKDLDQSTIKVDLGCDVIIQYEISILDYNVLYVELQNQRTLYIKHCVRIRSHASRIYPDHYHLYISPYYK